MELVILLTILFWAVIPCLITVWMFREHGWSRGLGLLLGILTGPLGILLALVLILISDRGRRGRRGKAFRLYYHFPVVGSLHVSTVWMLAGVATFLCVWALGGVWYEFRLAREEADAGGQSVGGTVAKSQGQQPITAGSPTATQRAEAKAPAAGQINPASSPSAPMLSSLAPQGIQAAQIAGRTDNTAPQGGQAVPPVASSNSSAGATATVAGVSLSPASPEPTQAAAPQPHASPPVMSREAAVSEVTRGLGARGHKVHASVSGDAQTSTLSLSGATLTREAGNQVIGNRRVREALKGAGVRIVVMINGQESWTYML
ncbi:MAG TPA: hypothetical protein VD968_00535 [Pyrinomonadaceae bacterium]|nr:hypothetical protein [Pyrinomonadaceae bacterium]